MHWSPARGLSSARLAIDGQPVADSVALLSAGEARFTLKARSRIEVTLRGARGASIAVRVLAPAIVTRAVFTGAASTRADAPA